MAEETADPWLGTPVIEARIAALVTRIAAVMRQAAWQTAAAHGLTPTQADVLQLLADRPHGLRLSSLAQWLAVTPATASDAVSSLVAKGLVRKAKAHDDGRALALLLTPAGEAAAASVRSASQLLQDAAGQMPAEQRCDLFSALLSLVAQLQNSERFVGLRTCVTCRHFEPYRHREPRKAHHCHLVNAPLPSELLRVDCAEHVPAEEPVRLHNWAQLGSVGN